MQTSTNVSAALHSSNRWKFTSSSGFSNVHTTNETINGNGHNGTAVSAASTTTNRELFPLTTVVHSSCQIA